MRLAQPMDVDVVDSELPTKNKVDESKITVTAPTNNQTPDVKVKQANNANFLATPQNKRSSIRKPRSSIKRPRSSMISIKESTPSLPSCTLSPISSSSSCKSYSPVKSENSQKSGIQRPRLSITRPTRTVKKTNVDTGSKRLSLSSISSHMVKNEDFETLSNKSTESRYSVNSKISLISSASARSIFTNSTYGSAYGCTTPDPCEKDEVFEQKMKEMKLKNAKLDSEIEKMKIEKEYYANIIESIKSIASSYNGNKMMDVDDDLIKLTMQKILEI